MVNSCMQLSRDNQRCIETYIPRRKMNVMISAKRIDQLRWQFLLLSYAIQDIEYL